jgi:hypothetical protein
MPKDLRVYKKAYALAMDIFKLSKSWPVEEKYSLTNQIRRSFRSVCSNLREAWAKRRYEAHFISKLTDEDGENPGGIKTNTDSTGQAARQTPGWILQKIVTTSTEKSTATL